MPDWINESGAEWNICCNRAWLLIAIVSFQGVQVGDELLKFGSLTARNFQGMQNLTTVVQHGKGVSWSRSDVSHQCQQSSLNCYSTYTSTKDAYMAIYLLFNGNRGRWLSLFLEMDRKFKWPLLLMYGMVKVSWGKCFLSTLKWPYLRLMCQLWWC